MAPFVHALGSKKPMHKMTFALGVGLLLLAVAPAPAEIIKGVMAIKGAEMS